MTSLSTNDPLVRDAAYERRAGAVRPGAIDGDVDVVVAYSSAHRSFIDFSQVWWLSGLRQLGPHAALVVPADGAPVLVVTPSDAGRAGDVAGVGDVRVGADFARTLRETIAAVAAGARRVGLAAPTARLTIEQDRTLEAALAGRARVDVGPAFEAAARRRDPWSMTLLRRATEIAEAGFAHLVETIRPGTTDRELYAGVEARLHELGADETFLPLVSSRAHRGPMWTCDGVVEAGSVFLAELSPSVDGEFTQLCRTIVLTTPEDPRTEVLDAYALSDASLRAGLAALAPGVTAGAVAEAMNAPIVAAGLGAYAGPPYVRTRGHALGLGATGLDIAAGSGKVLDEGMAFVIHPNQYFPDAGVVLCGESVLITARGSEILASAIGELVVLEAR